MAGAFARQHNHLQRSLPAKEGLGAWGPGLCLQRCLHQRKGPLWMAHESVGWRLLNQVRKKDLYISATSKQCRKTLIQSISLFNVDSQAAIQACEYIGQWLTALPLGWIWSQSLLIHEFNRHTQHLLYYTREMRCTRKSLYIQGFLASLVSHGADELMSFLLPLIENYADFESRMLTNAVKGLVNFDLFWLPGCWQITSNYPTHHCKAPFGWAWGWQSAREHDHVRHGHKTELPPEQIRTDRRKYYTTFNYCTTKQIQIVIQ